MGVARTMAITLAAAALLLRLFADAANIALPGCESKCGDVDVPYPFGTTAGCYRPGFMLTCRPGAHGSNKLFLGRDGQQVLEVSVQNSTVRVSGAVWFFDVGDTSMTPLAVLPAGRPYVLSAARNRLVHIGCGFRASSWTARQQGGLPRASGTCNSSCSVEHIQRQKTSPRRCDGGIGWCDGIGCCDAPIPPAAGGLASFGVQLEWNKTSNSPWLTSEASVVAVEQEWWSRKDNLLTLKMSLLALGRASATAFPVLLDWAFDNSSTCSEAANRPDFGCVSKHSECLNSTGSAGGYVCQCRPDYHGNPYVPDGCQRRRSHSRAGTYFATGVGIGMCILLLVLATILFATKELKGRKAKKMRAYFFKQNRGLLLQQLVDKDIAERMIFTLEELENATNKFDKARISGGGGHGTVYKGILSDQHVVAIKRPKFMIQKEKDGFINEVAILSQINHRNVVKLFGCCLETEVPLLVYEFIPNGTLYSHLHVNSSLSLLWEDRLRIALEVASSLAYLHSAASISIVHRDIKTSNILLDDHLTAKVSDFGASRGIAIDRSGVTTAVQGTYGYLDPEYFYTGRLTEKSDVYNYGVMLVELLTRKKPNVETPLDGVSLVAQFMLLLSEDRLVEILDIQIMEEGEDEAKQVAAIAALCLQMKGDDRPTMRHVEMRLQGLLCSNNNYQDNLREQEVIAGLNNTMNQRYNTVVAGNVNTRRYSLDREILLSTTMPR